MKRIDAGLTKRLIAKHLKYSSAQFISNFECGISLPPFDELKRLLEIYDMPKDEVLALIVSAQRAVFGETLRSKANKGRAG